MFNFPRNITRSVGSTNPQILCSKYPIEATPFWKINETTYYFSEVPPPFIPSPSGRVVTIPVVEVSLNQTSFQCFIPTSDGGLFSSPIGILTVLTTDIGIGCWYAFICLNRLYFIHYRFSNKHKLQIKSTTNKTYAKSPTASF